MQNLPPLSEQTVAALIRSLLEEDDSQRVAELASVLRDDADLTGWVASAADKSGDAVDELVDWLDTNAPDVLPVMAGGDPTACLARLGHVLARLRQLEADFESTLLREKLNAMKELAYGASHEINNPLANISTRAQTLLRDEQDPERRRKLATINTQAFRAHEMISDMMLFARPATPVPVVFDVGELIASVIHESADEAASQGTTLVANLPDEPVLLCADLTQVAVALQALVRNSLEALPSGGRVEVAAAVAGQLVELSVSDTGPGIPADVRPHIFDPFFSGREAGRGLGFGLSKCWRIVTMHAGEIRVESEPGFGATFTMRFPAKADGAARELPSAA